MTPGEATAQGSVTRLRRVYSPERGNTRDLHVYLPPSYASSDRRFPVIYMQDGQNLFDPALAFLDDWGVDRIMEAISTEGLDAIVVGIPNMGQQRFAEYSPFADVRHGGGDGKAYVRFIAETVKPRIDREFRTRPDRDSTGVLGSSMGGLISLFAFFDRGDTFGFAGVMSPALWFGHRQIFREVEEAPFVRGRIHLDVGTGEGEMALRDVRRLKRLLESKGYRQGDTLSYVEDPGGKHTERTWSRRLPDALAFLLPEPVGQQS